MNKLSIANVLLGLTILTLLCIMYNCNKRNLKYVYGVLIVVFLLSTVLNLMNSFEGFLFEVTPWKKTCLNDRRQRSCKCCVPGFNGQKISFEYTDDRERLQCGVDNEKAMIEEMLKQTQN